MHTGLGARRPGGRDVEGGAEEGGVERKERTSSKNDLRIADEAILKSVNSELRCIQ